MPISNFPAALQPIIQQGFLQRAFERSLRSRLGYRAVADRETLSVGVGETLTKTRTGLKPAVTTPVNPAMNTNLDNGLTPSGWGVEQYTITMNMFADTTDLNMITSRVAIASQFVKNAEVNAEQAARSMDDLARNTLFNSYMGGNTRVRTTLGAAGPTVAVDDVRGFRQVPVNGVLTPVSPSATATVTVNGNPYTLVGFSVDGTNASTAPGGISGTLTFSANVVVADATAGNAVVASTAPAIVRPNARATTAGLVATDKLTMAHLLDAKAVLEANNVPSIDGFYNAYLDPVSARQLFADADFKQLFQGATAEAGAYKNGVMDSPFLGLRFVRTNEAFVQTLGGLTVRRPIVCGAGALIEGDFAATGYSDVAGDNAMLEMVDGVCMVTREPLDRLQQIIAQSWYWIGGFCAPTDTTTNPAVLPTATNAAYKRAVVIEHV